MTRNDLAERSRPAAPQDLDERRVGRGGATRRHLVVLGLPAVAALLVGLWKSGRPSLWSDELVTIEVALRSPRQILDLLGHVDAVHGLYYFLMHAVLELSDPTPTVVRLPSVLATAVAAAALASLGRTLAGAAVGLLAGLAYAFTPVVSQYALEARSYALVSAAAVVATVALVQALRRGRARWFVAYATAVVALGALHLFAVLLVGAHLVTVLTGRYERSVRLGWLLSIAAAGAVLAPLAVTASAQQNAVEWIRPPDAAHLWQSVVGVTGSVAATALAALIAIAGMALGRTGNLLRVAVPWLVIPPALLLALSQIEPLFVARYVLFCVPAAALLIAAGLAVRPRTVLIPAGLALLALTLMVQPALRRPDGKWHDVTPIVRVLHDRARPGDAFLVAPLGTRALSAAYPHIFTPMNDLALAAPGARLATLNGRETPRRELVRRMRGVDRVWVIQRLNGNRRVLAQTRARITMLRRTGLDTMAARWSAKHMRLMLYVRRTED